MGDASPMTHYVDLVFKIYDGKLKTKLKTKDRKLKIEDRKLSTFNCNSHDFI